MIRASGCSPIATSGSRGGGNATNTPPAEPSQLLCPRQRQARPHQHRRLPPAQRDRRLNIAHLLTPSRRGRLEVIGLQRRCPAIAPDVEVACRSTAFVTGDRLPVLPRARRRAPAAPAPACWSSPWRSSTTLQGWWSGSPPDEQICSTMRPASPSRTQRSSTCCSTTRNWSRVGPGACRRFRHRLHCDQGGQIHRLHRGRRRVGSADEAAKAKALGTAARYRVIYNLPGSICKAVFTWQASPSW